MPEKKSSSAILNERGSTGTDIYGGIINEEYNTDLKGSKFFKVMNQMRMGDGTVKAMLSAISLPIRASRWVVEPASTSNKDKLIAAFVDHCLGVTKVGAMSHTWDKLLVEILLYLVYGFQVFEKVWKIEDFNDTVYGRKKFLPSMVKLKKLAYRASSTIYKWYQDTAGGLSGVQQLVATGDRYVNVDIPVEKLVVFINEQEGSNFQGQTILRPSYKHWFFKDKMYAIEAIGVERMAAGVPVVELDDEHSDDDLLYARNIVELIRTHERSGVVTTPHMKFRIEEGKLQRGVTQQVIRHHDAKMAMSILAEFLLLGIEGRGGGYALSQDKTDFFLLAIQAIAKNISETLNMYVIKELVDYNFVTDDYPKLQVGRLADIDRKGLASVLSMLSPQGFVTADEPTEIYLRKMLGLPEKQDEPKEEEKPKDKAKEKEGE